MTNADDHAPQADATPPPHDQRYPASRGPEFDPDIDDDSAIHTAPALPLPPPSRPAPRWLSPLLCALLLTTVLGWSGFSLVDGIVDQRDDLRNPASQQEEPALRVLLRHRDRNSDSHGQITVFVAQDAILYQAATDLPQWVTIAGGSSLHILPNVDEGFIIASQALSEDLSWHGGHLRLIPDHHNQVATVIDNPAIQGQEDIFRLLDPLTIDAADGRNVFAISGRSYRGSLEIHWHNARNLLAINHLGIEGYVKGVLQSELNVTWPLEALKAQAIASRSYAYSRHLAGGHQVGDIAFDVRDSVADQDYRGSGSGGVKIDWSVSSTRGQILASNGVPFTPYFHAASGGQLADISSVFPHARASNGTARLDQVMVAKADPFYAQGLKALGKQESHGRRVFSISSGELRNLLRERGEAVGWILRMAAERQASNHVSTVRLGWAGGESVMSGAAFRTLVGPNRLRSTLWDVESPRQEDGTFVITTQGWGHGVGLSQISMYAMAHLHGYHHRDILHFFYQQSTIERLW